MVDINARERLKLMLGGVSLLTLGNCSGGGGGSEIPFQTSSSGGASSGNPSVMMDYEPTPGLLKNNYRNNFEVGAAILSQQIVSNDPAIEILKDQYSSVSAEYEMKADVIAPTEGVFDFSKADLIVQFAEDNQMVIRGHTLLWHESTPDYFYEGSKEEIKQKLQTYVTEVVSRYRGRIKSWDVVNEVVAASDLEPTAPYRNSRWYQAVGSAEYIDWAFEAARAADPDAVLLLNEFNTELTEKRERLIPVLEDLIARNVPIDGVGHQCHLNYLESADSVLAAIDAIDDMFAGLVNYITELDVSVYIDPGSCWENGTACEPDFGENIPDNILQAQARLGRELFDGLILRSSVENVTFWGITDDQSWLNSSPIERTNYPLLFDRELKAKPIFRAITDRFYEI